MKNFVQEGDTVTVPAPVGGALSGEGVLIGALFGVAVTSAEEGAPVEIVTEGVFELRKDAGEALAIGAKAYWDPTAKGVTSTATDHSWIGVVTEAAASSAAVARVRLNHQPI